MTKPIFIVKLGGIVNQEQFNDTKEHLLKELKGEYHVLVAYSQNQEQDIVCECFNSDKAPEITMEKVKEIEELITKNLK
jgi:hypothetical protein